MARMVKGLFVAIIAAVAFYIFSLVDCLFADRTRFRVFGKALWVAVIVVLPLIGSVLWFTLGRRYGSGVTRSGRGVRGPDDDPDFLGTAARPVSDADRESMEERLRKLEQEFAEHDDDGPAGKMK